MGDFVKRFLRARDGLLNSEDSWRCRQKPQRKGALLGFVRPLELIEEEDWQHVLVTAAALPERYVEIEFLFLSTTEDEACRVFESHIKHFLEPLEEAGLTGSVGGLIDIRHKRGSFYIGLFPVRPEDLVSAEDAVEQLAKSGFKKKSVSDRTTH